MNIFKPDVYTKVNAIINHHLPDSLPQEDEPLAVTDEVDHVAEEVPLAAASPPASAAPALIDATEDVSDGEMDFSLLDQVTE